MVAQTRKPPQRRLQLYNATGSPMLLEMQIGNESYAYWVKRIHADYGLGFEFKKCPDVIIPYFELETYHVHYDPARQLSTCDCLGGTHHGNCKHQAAIVALIKAGKISIPAPRTNNDDRDSDNP